MGNKSTNTVLLVIIIILLVVGLGYVFFSNSKQKENKTTGAICMRLIDEPDKCYQRNELTCEQVCTKGMWTEYEGKITNPNFTKWEFSNKECIREEKLNTEVIVSPDGVKHQPGTIVVSRVVHDAGWGLNDAPTPTINCCCDY